MKIGFSDIIGQSIGRTREILFRPFNFKKWIILYVIALLAFEMQGGCNLNIPSGGKTPRSGVEESKTRAPAKDAKFPALATGRSAERESAFPAEAKPVLITVIVSILGIFLFLFVIFIMWIYSVFAFVFIESLANNDASIKKPFARNRPLGNSYFIWNVIVTAVFLCIFAVIGLAVLISLGAAGVFDKSGNTDFGTIFMILLPYVLTGIVVMSLAGLLSFFISNYVLVIMYKERLSIKKAVRLGWALLASDAGAFIKYILVKIALYIITGIMGMALGLAVFLGLLIPGAIIGGILWLIYSALPQAIQTGYIIALLVLGIPLLIALFFLLGAVFLPFSVFIKIFNLKFIARLNKRYDVFKPNLQEGG